VSRAVFYNGSLYAESDCAISPLSRAVHYGDGVFETMRSSNGCVFRLSEHLERLCSGLRLLRIPLPDPAQLAAATGALLRANALSDATIKIIAFRDGPPGPTPAATDAPCVLITAEPMDHDSRTRSAAGVSARIVALRRDETSPLSGIKCLNYLTSIMARLEAADCGDREALLLNHSGCVAEGATSNVFVVGKGALRTPPLSAGALPGITRAVVLEIARTLDLACTESDIVPEELRSADEIFLTNAGAGIMPLTMLDGAAVGTGRPGALTLRCQTAYNEIFTRETKQRT